MKVQSINNSSNTSFNAKLSVHKDVFQTVGIKTMLNGKDPVVAGKNLKNILIKADDQIRPLLPDVSLTIGNTRSGLNEYMVYSQVPGAPAGFIIKHVFGDINTDNIEETVEKIVSSAKTLLWSLKNFR